MNLPSAVLAKMLEKGLTLADVVEIAAVWEQEAAPATPSAGAVRARRYRQKRAGNVTSDVTDNVTRHAKDVSPTPPSENNPSPPKDPLKGAQKVPIPSAVQPEKPLEAVVKPLSWWVGEIWEITPRPGRERSGRPALEKSLRAAQRRGADLAAVKAGVAGYYASDDATKSQGQFAQGVHTVISSGRWESFGEPDSDDPPPDDPWSRRLLNWDRNQYWNSEWGPKPGKPGYQGPEAPVSALTAGKAQRNQRQQGRAA